VSLRILLAPLVVLGLLAGCGAPSSERSASAATPTPVAETAAEHCSPSLLAAGFQRDANYSGDLTSSQYSPMADVQAALLYDQYQSGYRTVLTALTTRTAPEVFASCVSMRFPDEQQATRFLSSYRDLRSQAGALAKSVDPGKVASLTDLVAYQEQQQSFQAYGITDANQIELAGRSGSRLFIATVAGSAPTLDHARALAAAMVSA
jgi:hypothetical protein